MNKLFVLMGRLLLLPLLFPAALAAQDKPDAYPTHWWVGMKNPKLQIMLHGKNIGQQKLSLNGYAGVVLNSVDKAENANYVFLNLTISANTRPGKLVFSAKQNGGTSYTFEYGLQARRPGKGVSFARGVGSEDFIYLLMPDRFSNGEPANDRVAGMKDQSLNRDSMYFRHGGDMQGVINHLDYLQRLGVTALWMTPVLENDMPNRTEHGYAFTDHYTIEPRLGGAEQYKRLSDSLHRRGMKLVQDAVYNHVGLWHFTVQDPPMKDWLHQWPSFTHPNYKDQAQFDLYGAQVDKKLETDGWFTTEMPDLNQGNPWVANFLIQHVIWCVEEFGVDGWRIDTYIYLDLPFMNRCNKALTDEYPNMTMFGEAWVTGTVNEAYFARNNLNTSFKSNLTGITDFQCLFDGIQPALKQPADGVQRLYQTLSNDVLYQNPLNNVIFLDNHDMTRFYSEMGEDVAKQKMGIAWLLTERGIPQLYYGTEVLMKGVNNPDGWVRLDFPGGWPGDAKSAFTGQGLDPQEADVLQYTGRFANFRQHSTAIKTGKLMQYVPVGGVYVYFRYDNQQTVMCVMNTTEGEQTIDLSRFSERMKGFTKAFDVATGNVFTLQPALSLGGKYLLVIELRK